MSDIPEFEQRNRDLIARMAADKRVRDLAMQFMISTVPYEYAYHFKWLGLPIIQLPADIIAIQEIVWKVRPRVIIETGLARGGSVVFHASLLELLGDDGRVVGVEVELRPHNREAITSHPMYKRIDLVDGSAIDPKTVEQVKAKAAGREPVLVILDSNHTHEHVLQELELYGPLVTKGSYMIVLDTVVEDLPADLYPDKAYRPGNSPKTAIHEFLKRNARFAIDQEYDDKLGVSSAPNGYLRCIG